MYAMILVVTLYNEAISVTSVTFTSEVNCLEAISKSLEMEKSKDIKVRARCVKQ